MRTLDEVLDQFAYHPATDETAPMHAAVRDLFKETATKLWDLMPAHVSGPERTLAFRRLQEAQMYANLAVALLSPADTGPTRGVARKLV